MVRRALIFTAQLGKLFSVSIVTTICDYPTLSIIHRLTTGLFMAERYVWWQGVAFQQQKTEKV